MNNIDKVIRYTNLFELYNSFLSSTQKEILSSYFLYNLSISEIAIDKEISRSAVEDALKKGMNKLDECEEKLHLLKRNEELILKLENIKKKALNLDEVNEIEEIEEIIRHGIWIVIR